LFASFFLKAHAARTAEGSPVAAALMRDESEEDEENPDIPEEEDAISEALRASHRGWLRAPCRLEALLMLFTSAGGDMTDPDGLVSLGELLEGVVRANPSFRDVASTQLVSNGLRIPHHKLLITLLEASIPSLLPYMDV